MGRFSSRIFVFGSVLMFSFVHFTLVQAFQQVNTKQNAAQQEATTSSEARKNNKLDHHSLEPVHELSAAVTLGHSNLLKMHSAKVELPSLEAGKRYRIKVAVSNPTEHEISFYGVELQCTCMKIEVKSLVIPAEGVGEFVFLIDVPKRSNKANATYQARFMERGKSSPTMQLTLSFEVNNMFSISEDLVTLDIPPGQTDMAAFVPILLVAPVAFDQLELVASENLRDLDIRLISNSEGAFVHAAVNRKNLTDGAISGEVAIRRKGTDDSVGFLLTARLRRSLELSPSTLRFKQWDGQQSSRYLSKAVLRVTHDTKDSEGETRLEPEVRLEIEGKPMAVELKRLGDSSVYRVYVVTNLPEGFDGSEAVEIKWSLSYGKEKREIQAHAYFSN